MRLLKRRNTKGQAAVEFAFGVLFIGFFILTITDFVKVCQHWTCLQFAVNEAARLGITGRAVIDPNLEFDDRHQAAMRNEINRILGNLQIDGEPTVTFFDSLGNKTAGTASNFFIMHADLPVFLGPGSQMLFDLFGGRDPNRPNFNVRAEALVRNEPFSS